jgi:hypothetical protein
MPFSPATDLAFGSSASTSGVNGKVNPIETYLTTYQNYIESALTGWNLLPSETWSYTSVSGILGTVTVASDATQRFQKGDKIRFTQSSTVKYFYVVSVTSTTLVITGGTDYTLTNNPITAISVSRVENPLGFPPSFAYTPALGNFTLGNGSLLGKFKLQSNLCYVQMSLKFGSTSSLSAGQLNFGSVPILASIVGSSDNGLNRQYLTGGYHDSGSSLYAIASYIAGDGSTLTIPQLHTGTGITSNTSPIAAWATGDGVFLSGCYLI